MSGGMQFSSRGGTKFADTTDERRTTAHDSQHGEPTAARNHCAAVSYAAARGPSKPRVCNRHRTGITNSVQNEGAGLGELPPSGRHASAERTLGTVGVARRSVGSAESVRANSAWWD